MLSYGKAPYSHIATEQGVVTAIRSGERPLRPDGCPDSIWALIESTWSASQHRPSFSDICSQLESLNGGTLYTIQQ